MSFESRRKIHDENGYKILSDKISFFNKKYDRHLKLELAGLEHHKFLRGKLATQNTSYARSIRHQPDMVLFENDNIVSPIEIMTEDKGWPNFSVEALKFSSLKQYDPVLVFIDITYKKAYASYMKDIPDPKKVFLNRSYEMDYVKTAFPFCSISIGGRGGSGTAYFLLEKKKLQDLDSFLIGLLVFH